MNNPDDTLAALPVGTDFQIPSLPPKKSWLILPDLSDSATQADWGAEIYRLVCQDCHGDIGRGLTEEFISTWNPQDQNCWQSKCHATNHPPEGFLLPQYIPAIIGDDTLTRFETTQDLFGYIREYMPWHNPGSLIEEEYWQLTAYLIRENGIDQNNVLLDWTSAKLIFLHENNILAEPIPAEFRDEFLKGSNGTWFWTISVVLLGTLSLMASGYWAWRRLKTK